MAAQITFFQGATGHNGGASTTPVAACSAFGSNSRQGDLIVVAYGYWLSNGTQSLPSAIADSQRTSYFPLYASAIQADSYLGLWWGVCAGSGANTVQATVAGSGKVSTCMLAMEFGIPQYVASLGFNAVQGNTSIVSVTSEPIPMPVMQGAFNVGTEVMLVSIIWDVSTNVTYSNSGMTGITQVAEAVEGTALGGGYVDTVATVTNGSTKSTTWSASGSILNSVVTILPLIALTPPTGIAGAVGYCFVL
jgi:hypothetical protein